MDMKDFEILKKCYDDAKEHRKDVAVILAEEYMAGDVSQGTLFKYKKAQLGVESTLRDLKNCVDIEVEKALLCP